MPISRCLKCDQKLEIAESPISGIVKIKWFCEECKSPVCRRCGIILGDWVCPACYDSHGEVCRDDQSLCLNCAESTGKIDIPAAKRFIEIFRRDNTDWTLKESQVVIRNYKSTPSYNYDPAYKVKGIPKSEDFDIDMVSFSKEELDDDTE